MVFLEPENPNSKTIKIDTQKQPIVIEGIGVGVIRNSKSGL